MEEITQYIKKLEKTYTGEKDLSKRHYYFLINTTKPEQFKNNLKLKNLWNKVFKSEESIIYRLSSQNVKFKIKFKDQQKTVSLKDVSKKFVPTWRAYLRHQFIDLGPANLEALIMEHKLINNNLKKIITICKKLNMISKPTNL